MFILALASSYTYAAPTLTTPDVGDPLSSSTFPVPFDGPLLSAVQARRIADTAGDTLVSYSTCEDPVLGTTIPGCLGLVTEDATGTRTYRRVTDATCSPYSLTPCYGGYVPTFVMEMETTTTWSTQVTTGDLRLVAPMGYHTVGSYVVTTHLLTGHEELEIYDADGVLLWAHAAPIASGGLDCADLTAEELCEHLRDDHIADMNFAADAAYAGVLAVMPAVITATFDIGPVSVTATWDPSVFAGALRDATESLAIRQAGDLYDECMADTGTFWDQYCDGGQGGGGGGPTGDPRDPNPWDDCSSEGFDCSVTFAPFLVDHTYSTEDGTIVVETACLAETCFGTMDAQCECDTDECDIEVVDISECG